MSKRRGQENPNQRCGGEKRPRGRKHLYVVLDDWIKGFSGSLYTRSTPTASAQTDNYRDRTDGAKVAAVARHHLPEPPAVRLESLGADSDMFFTSLGSSKIFIVTDQHHGQTPALVYNAFSGGLAFGPHVPAQLQHGFNTIFMTTSYRDRPGLQKSTYSFSTKHCVWRWHAWTLPFEGPGHFDTELNTWVGLHKDGYVCACRVASDSGSATPMNLGLMQLDWQKLEAKLFRKDRERYIRASLTYMGRIKTTT